jgi:hypothetical protein
MTIRHNGFSNSLLISNLATMGTASNVVDSTTSSSVSEVPDVSRPELAGRRLYWPWGKLPGGSS